MNYEAIVISGAIFMAFGFMGLVWGQLKEADDSKAGSFLPFFPSLFTLGGVMMILVGFISPIILNAH
ncbi:hypothetical protein ACOI1C_10155 [Bacillus sp. DJP31]|uniref:hypothetical protein n=1 Tax=Bacillus sp. DJP31 TaxID=3409789 RepID=UPI003BB5A737